MERIAIRNARVLTLQGVGVRRGAAMRDLGVIERGFVTCVDGRIDRVDSGEPQGSWDQVVDARGCVCMPALVDAHAHLCWGGDRWGEWDQIRAGVPYPQILSGGGGILSTVRATRAATREQLAEGVAMRLASMARLGVGATDAKSGYGLDPETEGGDAAVDAILGMLRSRAQQSSVAMVGHEPVLGELVGRLLGGQAMVAFRKGAVALLDIDAAEGRGTLLALVPPEAVERP